MLFLDDLSQDEEKQRGTENAKVLQGLQDRHNPRCGVKRGNRSKHRNGRSSPLTILSILGLMHWESPPPDHPSLCKSVESRALPPPKSFVTLQHVRSFRKGKRETTDQSRAPRFPPFPQTTPIGQFGGGLGGPCPTTCSGWAVTSFPFRSFSFPFFLRGLHACAT
ncbi:hypothetical protein VTK73DRAFT_2339 [Phialemonium thermophilum]|uniref:Uncharacterized protein n=1 Tax=Phialemonium thermophilum TaxID=223376 RepID=A0ABR3X573_9PEZI